MALLSSHASLEPSNPSPQKVRSHVAVQSVVPVPFSVPSSHSSPAVPFKVLSPHAAADLEGVELNIDKIALPKSDKTTVVEGAGGVMVPLNLRETYLDMMISLKLPVILVTRHYLGSINHTMLSWKVLKEAGLNVIALVISGTSHESTESYFATQMDIPFIRINELEEVNSESIVLEVERLKSNIKSLIK